MLRFWPALIEPALPTVFWFSPLYWLSFTKEKRKDQYANQNTEQVGSTVGSLKGSVDLEAQKDANIKGSSVIAKENINISGSNVNIENTDSIYNAQEKHEFKRSGLSVSIGGQVIDKVNEAVSHVERANQVEDKRLAALHGYKAVESIEKNAGLIKDAVKDPSKGVSINVSIGSTKSKSESSSTTVVANGSNVKAEGDVKITSTEKDINIKGSNVEGRDVTLDAKENLNVTASETTNKLEQDSKSSSASVGVGFDIATGQVSSVTISGSKSKGEVDANSTSYNESTVKADKNLGFTSGKDTNIKGGKLSGEKVTGNVGGDLNIESKQDKNSYEEKNSSAGFGIGIDLSGQNKKDSQDNLDKKDKVNNANKTGIFGSAGKSDVDSKYESVTDQSGIYAGKEGFDINVGENTDLKGGIISSEAEKDKNKISTGTLTYEDIKNKAEYEAGSIGVNVDTSKDAEKKDAGVTPNIGVGAKDDAESTTKATVSEGEIEIRDKENQKQDLAGLNRDTKNSLNKLGEIFDKTKVEERQELAGLFGEIAYKAVGDLAIKNGWKEGSAEKNALHALVGGIMSELTDSGFLAGASGAMINEMIQDKLSDMFKDDPAMHQWASALIGGVVSQVVADNAQAGAGTASSGTKNNYLTHKQWNDYQRELAACNGDKEKEQEVHNKYANIDAIQDAMWLAKKAGEIGGPSEEVGVDLNGNPAYLTPGEVIVYGDQTVQDLIDNTNLHDQIVSLPDGNMYYVDEKGVMTEAYDGKEFNRQVVHGTEMAIKFEILPDPQKMTSDYVFVTLGASVLDIISSDGGYILDKQGNVYMFLQGSMGAGVSLPVSGGYGQGNVDVEWKNKYDKDNNNLEDAIGGISYGFGGSAIVSANVSKGFDGGPITVEIGSVSSFGTTMYSIREAVLIGNIYD